MTLIASLIHKKPLEVASTMSRIIHQDGILGFLETAAKRANYSSNIFLFNMLFGSMTRDKMIQQSKERGQYWEYGSPEKIEIQNQADGRVPEHFSK